MGIELKSASEIATMREAGRVTAAILAELQAAAKPGVSTGELDELAAARIPQLGAKSAFLNYRGYPGVLCASINEEVVHGIPSKKRKLKEGDIIGLDFGVIVDGYYADSAVTIPVGVTAPANEKLIEVTRRALELGIEQARVGNRVGDISNAIQRWIDEHDYEIVRDFVGHGIGRRMHEDPQIPNYGPAGQGIRLKAGMVLAIEPMVNLGTWEVEVLEDGWTAVTLDGKWSAHFEHTVVVTEEGPIVLTLR